MACRGSALYLGFNQGWCAQPGSSGGRLNFNLLQEEPWYAHCPCLNPRYSLDPLLAISSLQVVPYPQAILKFHRPSSLDYRACDGLQVKLISFVVSLHISGLNTGSFVMVELARTVRVLEQQRAGVVWQFSKINVPLMWECLPNIEQDRKKS